MVFGAIECPPFSPTYKAKKSSYVLQNFNEIAATVHNDVNLT